MPNQIRSNIQDKNLISIRRDQIAETALKLFLKKGYAKTGIRDIAKACKMPIGSIYNYIGTKNDILDLIGQRRTQPWTLVAYQNIRKDILDKKKTVRLALEEAIMNHIIDSDKDKNPNMLFNREIKNFIRKQRHNLLSSQDRITLYFKQILDMGIESGEFAMESSLAVAFTINIIAFDWGMRHWWLKQHFTLEEYARYQTKLIMNAILIKPV